MEIPNVTLCFLVREIKPFVENARVRKVQELPNNWLKITLGKQKQFSSFGSSGQLIVASDAVFLTSFSLPAKQQTSGFGAFLNKRLSGLVVERFYQHSFDRVLVLEIGDYFLIIELFAKGNVVLADKKYNIVAVQRAEAWKDRELKKNAAYKFPQSKGFSPVQIDEEKLLPLFREQKTSCFRALLSKVNIAPLLAEEAFFLSRIDKQKPSSSISAEELSKLCNKIKQLYDPNIMPNPAISKQKETLLPSNPAISKQKETLLPSNPAISKQKETLLPFPLKSAKDFERAYSINATIDSEYSKKIASNVEGEKTQTENKVLIALKKSLEKQGQELQRLEKEEKENRQKGEAIFANYLEIKNVVEQAKNGIMYNVKFGVKNLDKEKRKLLLEI